MSEMARKGIRLVKTQRRNEPKTGSPLASMDYIFEVDGAQVNITVEYRAIMTKHGQLRRDEVKKAVRMLIDIAMECGWNPATAGSLVLDEDNMEGQVAPRLGWSERFKP